MIAKGSWHGELVNFQIAESIVASWIISTGNGSNSICFVDGCMSKELQYGLKMSYLPKGCMIGRQSVKLSRQQLEHVVPFWFEHV